MRLKIEATVRRAAAEAEMEEIARVDLLRKARCVVEDQLRNYRCGAVFAAIGKQVDAKARKGVGVDWLQRWALWAGVN